MSVRIDKAGSDDQARSVDHPLGSAIKLSDFSNSPVNYSNIGLITWTSGSIHDRTIFDQEVVWHRSPPLARLSRLVESDLISNYTAFARKRNLHRRAYSARS